MNITAWQWLRRVTGSSPSDRVHFTLVVRARRHRTSRYYDGAYLRSRAGMHASYSCLGTCLASSGMNAKLR